MAEGRVAVTDETYTFRATFRQPWWEAITADEWRAMSPRERLLTKMAIPKVALATMADGALDVSEIVAGHPLRGGDSITITSTVTMS